VRLVLYYILVTEHAYFHQKSELLLLDTNVWVNVPASSFLKGKTDQYMEGDIEIALFLKKNAMDFTQITALLNHSTVDLVDS